jgi:hypothetical protein
MVSIANTRMGDYFPAYLSGVIEWILFVDERPVIGFSVDMFLNSGTSLDAEPEPDLSLLLLRTRLFFILDY